MLFRKKKQKTKEQVFNKYKSYQIKQLLIQIKVSNIWKKKTNTQKRTIKKLRARKTIYIYIYIDFVETPHQLRPGLELKTYGPTLYTYILRFFFHRILLFIHSYMYY